MYDLNYYASMKPHNADTVNGIFCNFYRFYIEFNVALLNNIKIQTNSVKALPKRSPSGVSKILIYS